MSRRLPALSLLTVLCLVAMGVSVPFVPAAIAATPYGSHVFQANPYVVPGAQSYPVYSGSIVAQSFLVNETYYLQNVTLRVQNEGSKVNSLNVSIHPDDSVTHVPVMGTTLGGFSEVTPNNLSVPVNWNWPLNPAILLQAGQTYWIVAQNGAPQANNGYEWYSTNGTTYPDGEALLGSPNWAGLPDDMFFITFGQQYDANLTPGLVANRTSAQPNDFVTFTVHFNNTGSQAAPRAWINDTLPAALSNVSLSFPGIQPISAAAFPNLVFANVTNGPHFFTLTVQVAIGTPPGTVATNTVSLAYVDSAGAVVHAGSRSAAVQVGLVTKQLYLAGKSGSPQTLTTRAPVASTAQTTSLPPGSAPVTFALSPPLAEPLHAINVTAKLWLATQKLPPQTYRLTLALLDNSTTVATLSPSFQITAAGPQLYSFAFPVTGATFGRDDTVGLAVTNLGGGGGSTDALVLSYNSTSRNAHLDIVTDTYVAIQPLSLANQEGPTALWSSLDSLIIGANVSDPFGTSRIAGVWINITTPSAHLAAAGPMTVVLADSSSPPAWELLTFTLAPPLQTGRYHVVVTAMEDNGVTTRAEAWASVAMPQFTFAVDARAHRVVTGDTVAFDLWYNNTGTGPAGWAWINDTLPAGLAFIGSNVTATSVSGSTYTWALTDVGVGSHAIELDVLVTGTAVDWVQDQATVDYKDTSGHSLATLSSSDSLFLNGPIIALSIASTPSIAVHSNESVTYSITLVNTGQEAAQVWVNDLLPTEFTYHNSTEALLGGSVTVSGPYVNFTFTSMPANTTWHFDLVATAGSDLMRGDAYVDSATVVYTSLTGVLMPVASASDALTAVAPWFPFASIVFLGATISPGGSATAQIALDNYGNEAASHVWLNLTLDPRLSVDNASLPRSGSTDTVTFDLGSLGVGLHSIFVNFTANLSSPDKATLTVLGTLDADDGYGNPLGTLTLMPASITVRAIEMALSVNPTVPTFEASMPGWINVTVSNLGSDIAADVWLNLSLPANLLYVTDSFSTSPSVSSSGYSWHRTNLSHGSFSMQIYLEPRATVANGAILPMRLSVEAQGSNHVQFPGVNLTVNAVVQAPVLVLAITSSESQVNPSADFAYTLEVTNNGPTVAGAVYVVDALDPRLQLVFYDATVVETHQNQTYNWTFTNLAPGHTEIVNLTVHVTPGTPAQTLVANAFEVTYTNSLGVVLGKVRSSSVTVTVGQDLTLVLALGLATVGSAAGVVLYTRRRKVDIEEVFLVYRDGVLISHLSRTLLREKDEDVLSGMLTAVQEFVREAFQYGEHRDLHQMDFGDYRILIERGKYVFLAIVYSGRESVSIHKKIRADIARIEQEFGPALENWDGDMEQVMGARDLIRETLLGSSNHNHAPKAVAETKSE